MTNLKQFIFKNKPVIYIKTFIQRYNKKNYKYVHKIYGIINLLKILIFTKKNLINSIKLDFYQITKIFLILYNTYLDFRD